MSASPGSHAVPELAAAGALPLLLAAGLGCGLLNALASSGSALTLPLLLLLGLDPATANATNRLPVVVGALSALVRFQRQGAVDWRLLARLAPSSLGGTVLGAVAAQLLPAPDLRLAVTAAVLLALLVVLAGLNRLLAEPAARPPRTDLVTQLAFFAIGCWLGFIVLDGATYLLLGLVLLVRLPLLGANGLKAALIFLSSLVTLAIFADGGSVAWGAGSFLAIGSLAGGWLGASLAARPAARLWTVRILLGVIVLEAAHLLSHYLPPPGPS
ncbi:MAG: sulfite exporter TauE/SafE family protein [Geminicoccaceae bacterium]